MGRDFQIRGIGHATNFHRWSYPTHAGDVRLKDVQRSLANAFIKICRIIKALSTGTRNGDVPAGKSPECP